MATRNGTVGNSALISALQEKVLVSYDEYQGAKRRFLDASEKARVSMLEYQKAAKAWERCSVAVEEASATLDEIQHRKQRAKEDRRKDVGGHAQHHAGAAEDLTQKIYATDDEEKEEEKEENCHVDKEK